MCLRIEAVTSFVEWDINIEGVQEGRDEPAGSGWEEGLYITAEDAATRASCNALKDDNVTVYTIGFALEAGGFRTNDWSQGNVPGGGTASTAVTEQDKLNRAISLMQHCASTSDTFLLADNATELDIAFEQIGQAIFADLVRLTN